LGTTKNFNVIGYAAEIVDFLNINDRFLDGGYSALLKQETWSAGRGVEADAVGHIMSDAVQVELVGIVEKAAASSLDVERKHNQDKRSETTKVTGCSAASRNLRAGKVNLG
jgi:hypothetical protein